MPHQNTTSPKAAGEEIADFMDDDAPLDGEAVQQGAAHADRPTRTGAADRQGPKTQAANKDIVRGRME